MEAIQDDVDAAMDEIEDEIGKKAFYTHAVGKIRESFQFKKFSREHFPTKNFQNASNVSYLVTPLIISLGSLSVGVVCKLHHCKMVLKSFPKFISQERYEKFDLKRYCLYF